MIIIIKEQDNIFKMEQINHYDLRASVLSLAKLI